VQRNAVVTRWYIAVLLRKNKFDHNPAIPRQATSFHTATMFLTHARKSAGALMPEIKCYAFLYWVGDLRWLLAFELLPPANRGQWLPSRFKAKLRAVRDRAHTLFYAIASPRSPTCQNQRHRLILLIRCISQFCLYFVVSWTLADLLLVLFFFSSSYFRSSDKNIAFFWIYTYFSFSLYTHIQPAPSF